MIVLHALAETLPPDHTGVDPDRRTTHLEGRGGTYDEAMAALRRNVPDGMRLIWVRRPGADDPSSQPPLTYVSAGSSG